MIVSSSLPAPTAVLARPPGTLLIAAVDVEWSKNYRVRSGDVPFFYSVALLTGPHGGAGTSLGTGPFLHTPAHLHKLGGTPDTGAKAEHHPDGVF